MLSAAKRQIKQALKPVVRNLRPSDRVHLPPEQWGLSVTHTGMLSFGELELHSLLEKFGSPLHVVLEPLLRRNISDFLSVNRGGEPPRAEIYYSYKSNPIPGVLRYMHGLGIGAEVISPYELWLAFRLGVEPDRIIYNGPAKSVASIRQAIDRDILLLNVNHLEEIPVVAAAARDLGRTPRIGVRVSASGGWSGQFGIPIANGEAFSALRQVHESGCLKLAALHSHVGGMVRTAEQVRAYVKEVLALADRVRQELGVELAMLDFGGSLATPTVAHISQFDRRISTAFQANPSAPSPEATIPICDYVKLIVELVEAHYAAMGMKTPRILLEPGRAMTGNTQLLLSTVLSLKAGEPYPGWAILDAGINLAECMRNEFHQIFPATRMHEARNYNYRLAGPICSPGDVVSWSAPLPKLAAGDTLAFMDAGAYFVPFATSFSFPQPAVVMVQDGEAALLRRAETFDDLVALDCLNDKSREERALSSV